MTEPISDERLHYIRDLGIQALAIGEGQTAQGINDLLAEIDRLRKENDAAKAVNVELYRIEDSYRAKLAKAREVLQDARAILNDSGYDITCLQIDQVLREIGHED